jgi:hypothetical protein
MPSYLDLAYEGNYAGIVPWNGWEIFTLNGTAYLANPATDEVVLF